MVMKALRKSVDERYQTIKELESDLKKLKQRVVFQTELERSMGPETISPGRYRPFADTEIPHRSSHLSFQHVGPGGGAVHQHRPKRRANARVERRVHP